MSCTSSTPHCSPVNGAGGGAHRKWSAASCWLAFLSESKQAPKITCASSLCPARPDALTPSVLLRAQPFPRIPQGWIFLAFCHCPALQPHRAPPWWNIDLRYMSAGGALVPAGIPSHPITATSRGMDSELTSLSLRYTGTGPGSGNCAGISALGLSSDPDATNSCHRDRTAPPAGS